jgi:LysM repeat protein
MIFYGTNGALIRTEPLPTTPCPACATPGALNLSVYSRYAHIYWIPLFPYSKPAVVQCGHCQQGWDGKALPGPLQPVVQEAKKSIRAPWWHWSGLGVIALLIVVGVVASRRDASANKAYLAAPRAGDIYTVRSPEDSTQYSLLKVVSAKGNTVELVANNYQIDNRHPLDELNSPEKYGKEPISLTQFELQIMQNKDQLIDVDRPGE